MFESDRFSFPQLWQRICSVPRQLRLTSACFTSTKCLATGLFKPPVRSELRCSAIQVIMALFVFPPKASLEGQLST